MDTEALPTSRAQPIHSSRAWRDSICSRHATLLASMGLVFLVWSVFWPILNFGFVELDVYDHVINNPYIRGLTPQNVWYILTHRCIFSYYPVRTLTFALDYQIWGLRPFGFELTNGLIHTTNVLLVFWLIRRLFGCPETQSRPVGAWWDVCLAAFATGVFAIHPVVVEPVTWVCGREELLMTLGALGSLHFHLTARRCEAGGKTARAAACHAAAIACCALACFSNAVGAVVPFVITAYDVFTRPKAQWWKTALVTAPLWALCALTVWLKIMADADIPTGGMSVLSLQRLAMMLNVYWVNLRTLAFPVGLAPYYGRLEPPGLLDREVLFGGLAIAATCTVLRGLRRRPLILFGLTWFLLALAPTAQIVPHHIARGDRFLYLPLAALVTALAISARPLGEILKGRAALGAVGAGVAILFVLDLLCAGQVQTWRNDLALWTHCASLLPGNPRAQVAVADALFGAGKEEPDAARKAELYAKAVRHYERARELEPDFPETLNNYALFLTNCEMEQFRDYPKAIELARRACAVARGKSPAYVVTLASVYANCATYHARKGEFGPAVYFFRRALETDPRYEHAALSLVRLLRQCEDPAIQDPQEAVRVAEQLCAQSGQGDPYHLGVLAAAYFEAGQFDQAVITMEKAVALAHAGVKPELAPDLERLLDAYRNPILGEPEPEAASDPSRPAERSH